LISTPPLYFPNFLKFSFKNKTLLGNHAIPRHFQKHNVLKKKKYDCVGQAVEGRGECELFGQKIFFLGKGHLILALKFLGLDIAKLMSPLVFGTCPSSRIQFVCADFFLLIK